MVSVTGRIDVHQHAITPRIAALMRAVNAPFVLPWSLPETWDIFAENGIGFGLLSNPIPGGFFSSAGQAAGFVTAVNESTAELRGGEQELSLTERVAEPFDGYRVGDQRRDDGSGHGASLLETGSPHGRGNR